jgi:hypothetical protein
VVLVSRLKRRRLFSSRHKKSHRLGGFHFYQ